MNKTLEHIVDKSNTVLCQDWIESERGWGIRPDGCTLHLNAVDHHEYIKEYWSRMPKETPDEYSRPNGQPELVIVNKKLYERVAASKNGIALLHYTIVDAHLREVTR